MKTHPEYDHHDLPLQARPPAYHSYLLRFWAERTEQSAPTVWRFSLEDPLTDQRHGFPHLEALMAWLQTEILQAEVKGAPGSDNEGTRRPDVPV